MSNRLTFSLASLIVLIAFGLVFVAAPAMAHKPAAIWTADDPTTTFAKNHDGIDNSDTTPPIDTPDATETNHTHTTSLPTITSIELVDVKIGANKAARDMADAESTVKDTSVLLVNNVNPADDAAVTKVTTGANGLFRIKITFSENVYAAAGQAANFGAALTGDGLATDLIAAGSITDVAASQAAPGVQITALTADGISRVSGTSNAFYATITVPSDNLTDVPMDVWLGVKADAAYSKGKFSVGNNTNGRANTASSQYKFSVVKTLPTPVDTTPPTVVIADPTKDSDGNIVFVLTFSKELGPGDLGLQVTDFTITGGSADSLVKDTTNPKKYTLKVTPDNTTNPTVTISLKEQRVQDAHGNSLVIGASTTASYDKIAPMVASHSAAVTTKPTGAPAGTYLAFTFTFDEAVQISSLTVDSIDQSVSHNVVINSNYLNARRASTDPNTVITITVRAKNASMGSSVTLKAGTDGVQDLAGNTLAENYTATYQMADPEDVPPTITIGATGYMVGTTVKGLNCDVGNVLTFSYMDPAPTDASKPAASGVKTGSKVEKSEVSVVTAGWEITGTDAEIKLVPKKDRSPLGVTAVEVKVAADAIEDNAGNKSKETKMIFTVGPVLEIPAGGYIVVLRTNAYPGTHLTQVRTLVLADPNVEARQPTVQYWDCMPDLSLVFDVKPTAGYLGGGRLGTSGGGLLLLESYEQDKDLTKQAIAKGTVGISEIMWAQDQGTPFGRDSNLQHAREQWIEIHNFSHSGTVKVTLFDLNDVEAYNTVSYTGEIDRVSNFNVGGRWEAGEKGQDGDSERGLDFISMQRTRPTDTAKNYSHGDHNGTNGGKWSKSGFTYLTRRAGLADRGIDLGDNNLYDFYGTPGRQNDIKYTGPVIRTDVKRSPVIFNEIANRSNANRYYEWIELRNVTDAEVNLREYRISYVTAKDSDTELYTFPDNDDTKIPAKSVLLLVDTDPRGKEDHPIAADNPNMKYKVTDFKGDGLPDDGKFVLLLRKANGDKPADLKSVGDQKDPLIVDVAGYDDNLSDTGIFTSLWPLSYFGAPLAHNKIEVETVHHRQHVIDPDKATHGDKKPEHAALRDASYTGIGHKRLIPDIPAHGGTPGYDNGVAKEYNDGNATASAAPVTISEIMYHTESGRLPQWIELYNSSINEVVKVDDWTLQLENADDVSIRTPRVSVKLAAKLIQPNQTILIAASVTGNHSDHFPDSRVIDIWTNGTKNKDRLEIDVTNRRKFKILSETAFKITLKDKAGKVVDVAGNLGADPAWELPKQEDGAPRSSIIRRYDEGDVRDGTLLVWEGKGAIKGGMKGNAGWVLASASELYETQEVTYYGNIADKGSPGYRAGGPVPVSLSKFRPERLDDGSIVIRWITESELNNAGFNILRSEKRDGQFTKINTSLIAGHGTTSERNTYEWKDTSAKPTVVYYYQIQDVSLDGKVQTLRQSRLKGDVSPAGKATTTWGEIKALQ